MAENGLAVIRAHLRLIFYALRPRPSLSQIAPRGDTIAPRRRLR